jgi:AcrR family transcriptional regulator
VSSYTEGLAWQGEPLPRGRHKLEPEEVRASQRRRIARAMIESVAERGYEAVTVGQVVAAARVSRNAFYEFFADKTDCFLTVTDELGSELLDQLVAVRFERSWLDALRLGTRGYLDWWQEHVTFGQAYFFGLAELGRKGLARRQAAYERFAAIFVELGRRAREEQPGLAPLPDLVPSALVYAITEIVAEEIRAGRGAELSQLESDLFVLIVRLLADDSTAEAARPA